MKSFIQLLQIDGRLHIIWSALHNSYAPITSMLPSLHQLVYILLRQ